MKEEVTETKKKVEQLGKACEKKFEEMQQQLKDTSTVKPSKLMKLHCYWERYTSHCSQVHLISSETEAFDNRQK